MKAKVIRSLCAEGQEAASHGSFFLVIRLYLPGHNGLVITAHEGQVTAFENYRFKPRNLEDQDQWGGDEDTGREVEVPDSLVEAAKKCVEAEQNLATFLDQVKQLTGGAE